MTQESENPKMYNIDKIGENENEQNNFCTTIIFVRTQEGSD